MNDKNNKSKALTCVLNFLFPGYGQLYLGKLGKWIAFRLITWMVVASFLIGIGFIAFPIWTVYAVYSGAKDCDKYNGEYNPMSRKTKLTILAIILLVIGIVIAGGFYVGNENAKKTKELAAQLDNNTTNINTTVEKISSDDNYQASSDSYDEPSNSVMVKREDGQGYMEIDKSQAEYSNGVWHQSKA